MKTVAARSAALSEGLRYYTGRNAVGRRAFSFSAQKASPIISGEVADLSFYPVRGKPDIFQCLAGGDIAAYRRSKSYCPMDEYWYGQITQRERRSIRMPFLENYLLVTTKTGKTALITDDHSHAVYGWALAQRAGLVRAPAGLVHIDEHYDRAITQRIFSRSSRPLLADLADFVWQELDIASFIDLGLRLGARPLLHQDHIYYVLTDGIGSGEFSRCPGSHYELSGFHVALERGFEAVRQIREAGLSVIADIDLDFFYHFYTPAGPAGRNGLDWESALAKVIEIARRSDFITIATSPQFFLVRDQKAETKRLLQRIISAL